MTQSIKITGLELDGHSLPIPEGLDMILNKGNGWGINSQPDNGYEREVIKENGKLFTVLRKK